MACRLALLVCVVPVCFPITVPLSITRQRSLTLLPRSRLQPLHAKLAEERPNVEFAPSGERLDSRHSGKLGVLVSAGGLVATFWTSVSALTMTGMLATIAASAAGLFTFKLANELHVRGVDSNIVSRTADGIWQRLIGGCKSLVYRCVRLLVYCLAALASTIAAVLGIFGSAALTAADVTSRISAPLDPTFARRLSPNSSIVATSPPPTPSPAEEARRPVDSGMFPLTARVAGVSAETSEQPPPPSAPRSTSYRGYPAPPSAAVSPPAGFVPGETTAVVTSGDDNYESMGQRLAVEQMLQRSASAAAASKKVDVERADILRAKQQEAVARALSDNRQRRVRKMATDSISPYRKRPVANTAKPPSLAQQMPVPKGKAAAFAPKTTPAASSSLFGYRPPSTVGSIPAVSRPPFAAPSAKGVAADYSSLAASFGADSAKLDVSLAAKAAQAKSMPAKPIPAVRPACQHKVEGCCLSNKEDGMANACLWRGTSEAGLGSASPSWGAGGATGHEK